MNYRLYVVSVFALVIGSRSARSDDLHECVSASATAQDLRRDHKLIEARAQLLICSREVCPRPVNHDCKEWLADVDSSMPTIVISLKDAAGVDVTSAHVLIDGALFTERLDGNSVAIDPGNHEIRIERWGTDPLVQDVLIREGEKNRSIAFSLPKRIETVTRPPASREAPVAGVPQERGSAKGHEDSDGVEAPPSTAVRADMTSRRKVAVVVASAGLVTVAVALGFGLHAHSQWNDAHASAQGGAPPDCDSHNVCNDAGFAEVDAAYSSATISTVLSAVGVIAVGAGAYLWFTGESVAPRSATSETRLTPIVHSNLVGLSMQGRF